MRMGMRRHVVGVILFAMCCFSGARAWADYHVSALNGDDLQDGLTWGTAKKTIQAAIDAAPEDDTILVSNGVYEIDTEILVPKAVTVRGVNGADETVIDAGGACRCLRIADGSAVVEGFSIRNGFTSDKGAGVYAPVGGSLRDCHVYNNVSSNADSKAGNQGGGLWFQGGRVTDCVIYSNRTSTLFGGGGAYIGGAGSMERCVAFANYSYGSGGGIRASDGGTLVQDCAIYGNSAAYGGGISVGGGASFRRCDIWSNAATAVWGNGGSVSECRIRDNPDGGVALRGGSFRNCVVSHNGRAGVGISNADAIMESCTVSGNETGVAVDRNVAATNVVCNSIVNGNASDVALGEGSAFAGIYSCLPPAYSSGLGNTTNAPLFLDAASGDYRLRPGSPCINAGTNLGWMAAATAIRGQPRIHDGRVDIGADETAVLYVWTNSPSNGPGTQWSNAFHTIQESVDASLGWGTVLVTNGTYFLTKAILVTNGAALLSAGAPGLTTVDGCRTTGCFWISHPLAVVDGFTITGGMNTAPNDETGGGVGGGVRMSAGAVRGCTIGGNRAYQGGGVWLDGGGEVSHCWIEGNLALDGAGKYGTGGGVWFQGGGRVCDSTIVSNEAIDKKSLFRGTGTRPPACACPHADRLEPV